MSRVGNTGKCTVWIGPLFGSDGGLLDKALVVREFIEYKTSMTTYSDPLRFWGT